MLFDEYVVDKCGARGEYVPATNVENRLKIGHYEKHRRQ
jgi:hypothetical protein